jgi:hypothetical protein
MEWLGAQNLSRQARVDAHKEGMRLGHGRRKIWSKKEGGLAWESRFKPRSLESPVESAVEVPAMPSSRGRLWLATASRPAFSDDAGVEASQSVTSSILTGWSGVKEWLERGTPGCENKGLPKSWGKRLWSDRSFWLVAVDSGVVLKEQGHRDVLRCGCVKGALKANAKPSCKECHLHARGCEAEVGVAIDEDTAPDTCEVGVSGVEAPHLRQGKGAFEHEVEGLFVCPTHVCSGLRSEDELAGRLREDELGGRDDACVLQGVGGQKGASPQEGNLKSMQGSYAWAVECKVRCRRSGGQAHA